MIESPSAIIEAKELHSEVKVLKEALLQETSSVDKPSTKKPAPFKFIKVHYNISALINRHKFTVNASLLVILLVYQCG